MEVTDFSPYLIDLENWLTTSNPQSRNPGNKKFDSEWNDKTWFNDDLTPPEASAEMENLSEDSADNFSPENLIAKSNLIQPIGLIPDYDPDNIFPITIKKTSNTSNFKQGYLTQAPITSSPIVLRKAKNSLKITKGQTEINNYLDGLNNNIENENLAYSEKVFYIPEQLKGMSGKIGIKPGFQQLLEITKNFANRNLNCFLAPRCELSFNYLIEEASDFYDNEYVQGLVVKQGMNLGLNFFDKPIETLIKEAAEKQYETSSKNFPDDFAALKATQPQSFAEALIHCITPLFTRLGLHGFPFSLPKNINQEPSDSSGKISADDYQSIDSLTEFNIWQFQQLDGIFGQFPLRIKTKDAEGKEHLLSFPNLAETLSELIGMLSYAGILQELMLKMNVKQGVEIEKTFLTALEGRDFAKSNADFMGYRIDEDAEEIILAFDPTAKNISDFLNNHESKTSRYKISEAEKNDLLSILNKIAISADIAKSAVFRQDFGNYPGKQMREKIDEKIKNFDDKWDSFVKAINKQAGLYGQIKNFTPNIDTL